MKSSPNTVKSRNYRPYKFIGFLEDRLLNCDRHTPWPPLWNMMLLGLYTKQYDNLYNVGYSLTCDNCVNSHYMLKLVSNRLYYVCISTLVMSIHMSSLICLVYPCQTGGPGTLNTIFINKQTALVKGIGTNV